MIKEGCGEKGAILHALVGVGMQGDERLCL